MKLLRRGSHAGRETGRLIYVKYPSRRVIWLVLFITVCSALDALFTLLHLAEGGGEANPYAALLMTYGDITFVSLKMTITGAGAWVLAALQQFVPAYLGFAWPDAALPGRAGAACGDMDCLIRHATGID